MCWQDTWLFSFMLLFYGNLFFCETQTKENDRKSAGERGHAGRLWTRLQWILKCDSLSNKGSNKDICSTTSPLNFMFSSYYYYCFSLLAASRLHVTPPVCPHSLKPTLLPRWLWGNFISSLQADCILWSSLMQYLFWAQLGRELKYPHPTWGYLGVRLWASGPLVYPEHRGFNGDTRGPALLPSSLSLSQLCQALTA